jgi:hypothetical protein
MAWARVTPAPAQRVPGAQARLLPLGMLLLLLPAVVLLAGDRGSVVSYRGELSEVAADAKRAGKMARYHLQDVSAAGRAALLHSVRTQLAEEVPITPGAAQTSEKVQLSMFMESRCPGCRHWSTTVLKEVLESPGMADIVDFHAVAWGWGTVLEAPTAAQMARNDTSGNKVNTTGSLLSLLQSLGSPDAKAGPPFRFKCQHGWTECQGNALEACLQDVAPETSKFFPMFDCIESRTCAEGMKVPECMGTAVEVAHGCFEEHGQGVDGHAVLECFNGKRAQELMLINDMKTIAAKPQWVPWFTIENEQLVSQELIDKNDTLAFKSQLLMPKKICDLYAAKSGKPPPAVCSTFPATLDEIDSSPLSAEAMQKKYPPTNFTKLIAEQAERKQLAAQQQQQRLAWEMQAARNQVMRRQEEQEIMDEQRDRMEQKRREMRAEQLQGKTHESSSIGSWVSSIWKQI